MKKFIVFVLAWLITIPVWADCSGKVVDFYPSQQIPDGRIIVEVQYSIDGQNEPVTDKWTVFPEKFEDKTNTEIKQDIERRLDRQCKKIIFREWKLNTSPSIIDNMENFRTQILNISKTVQSTEFKLDTDGDNFYDTKWTLKTDGTKTVSAISPPEPIE